MIELININCMELMAKYADGYFDLAIVDVPYGIGWAKKPVSTSGNRLQKNGGRLFVKGNNHKVKDWDENFPTQKYFDELFRVSKNQIIWGENYIEFNQKTTSTGRIFWDKINDDTTFSDGELAWCSLIKTIRQIEFMWKGMMQGKSATEGRIQQGNKQLNEKKIHPTQKPKELYKWILNEFAKEGDKILDTHLGSGSIAIAVDYMNKLKGMNLTLIASEIDKEYFDKMTKRFNEETIQTSLFLNEKNN
jgi:site-specific DNA-methyltransferase (adenine-specific)